MESSTTLNAWCDRRSLWYWWDEMRVLRPSGPFKSPLRRNEWLSIHRSSLIPPGGRFDAHVTSPGRARHQWAASTGTITAIRAPIVHPELPPTRHPETASRAPQTRDGGVVGHRIRRRRLFVAEDSPRFRRTKRWEPPARHADGGLLDNPGPSFRTLNRTPRCCDAVGIGWGPSNVRLRVPQNGLSTGGSLGLLTYGRLNGHLHHRHCRLKCKGKNRAQIQMSAPRIDEAAK